MANADDQIEFLLMSYSLEELLEDNDINPNFVVELLVKRGLINLEDYFITKGLTYDE